ncbi:MAG TPA: hypothetical protein VMS60_12415 [Solirubrobacterales bacterium]|nr:hypothetical protein [Solirubrobacterales bacterium]
MEMKLSVSETLGEIFAAYRAHARQLVPLAFWVLLVGLGISVAGESVLALALIGAVVQLTTIILFRGLVVELVRDAREDQSEPGSLALVWSLLPLALPLLGAGLVFLLGLWGGFLIFVVPGLILLTMWSVIAPAIVIERTGAIGSFRRSRVLTKGNRWRIFLVILAILALLLAVSAVNYAVVFSEPGGTLPSIVLAALISSLILPFEGLATATLYYRLLEIERAAPAPEPPAELAPAEA